MGLLSRAARGLSRRAIKTGDGLNALANYLMVTGALGGAAGGLMGASSEQSAGGDPNEGAIGGARAGAMMGPLAATALPLTMELGPVGASPLVPYMLSVDSASSEKRRARERKRMEEEAAQRAMELRLLGMHQ